MEILFPEAATHWKSRCPNCTQVLTIELVAGKRCLVFEVRGRRWVERIGLSDRRRHYYRVRCLGCDAVLVVADTEVGVCRGCHGCGLMYAMQADRGEIFYETEVRLNGALVTYRERVLEASGYVTDQDKLFFLDESTPNKPLKDEKIHDVVGNAALATAHRELKMVRKRDVALRLETLQAANQLEALKQRLNLAEEEINRLISARNAALESAEAVQLEWVRGQEALRLGERARMMMEEALRGSQERLAFLEEERRRLTILLEENELLADDLSGELTALSDEPNMADAKLPGWYCEEGREEALIPARDAIGLARRTLGICGELTVERIRLAYRLRVKRYHPDRLVSMGLALKELAHKKMQEINRAFGVLMKAHGHG
ncbi:MAG: hypothetical protein H7834_15960 [Magnetococcus sp. YQC-9]